jgi:hypothetical protein
LETLPTENPIISRNSGYRILFKAKINFVPQEKKEKAKTFKENETWYLHNYVAYLRKFNEQSYYPFIAIDRCTREIIYWIYENNTTDFTKGFMDKCFDFSSFYISHTLTDYGLKSSNKLPVSKKGHKCKKTSKWMLNI